MRTILTVVLLLAAGVAQAQDLPDYQFKLSSQQAGVVIQALSQLPYAQSAPVIQEMQRQAAEQQRAKLDEAKKDKP